VYNPSTDDVPDLDLNYAPAPLAKVIEMPAAVAAQAPHPHAEPAHPLLLPANATYGWLGDHARSLDTPLGWAYCSLLPLFAGIGINTNAADEQVHPTLYVALLGGVGQGKSLTMERARKSLRYHHDWIRRTTPASDRGLFKMFTPPGKPGEQRELTNVTLLQDELKNTMAKINIQGSSLATTLCTLWSYDEAGVADKGGDNTIHVRLSILGNLKAKDPEDFRKSFGSETLDGLYDRFVLCPGPTDWEPDFEWSQESELRAPSQVHVPAAAWQMLKEWRKAAEEGVVRHRLGEIALRVAVISASANHDTEVTAPCMAAALRFAEWQERVRAIYTPSTARNDDAALTSLILDKFAAHEKDNPGEWISFWHIARPTNWARTYGSPAITRTKRALINDNFLIEEAEEDAQGNIKRVRNARLRIRTS
jgi:hypothetical protein